MYLGTCGLLRTRCGPSSLGRYDRLDGEVDAVVDVATKAGAIESELQRVANRHVLPVSRKQPRCQRDAGVHRNAQVVIQAVDEGNCMNCMGRNTSRNTALHGVNASEAMNAQEIVDPLPASVGSKASNINMICSRHNITNKIVLFRYLAIRVSKLFNKDIKIDKGTFVTNHNP